LGLEADAVARALRRQLDLDTGEIAEVLAYPITPPGGTVVAAAPSSVTVDRSEATAELDARDEERLVDPPHRT
jgi:hypothetical protein